MAIRPGVAPADGETESHAVSLLTCAVYVMPGTGVGPVLRVVVNSKLALAALPLLVEDNATVEDTGCREGAELRMTRMRLFPLSEINRFPDASIDNPAGALNCAPVETPPSPV